MSLTTGSRALTLADVIDAIRVAEITDRRRQDMVCAVRRVAKLLGREPAQLPADPAALAVRLADAAPASQGLTQARWNNIRSLLGAAITLVRPVMKGRSITPPV